MCQEKVEIYRELELQRMVKQYLRGRLKDEADGCPDIESVPIEKLSCGTTELVKL